MVEGTETRKELSMALLDKLFLMDDLQKKGWTLPENPDCGSKGGLCMIPPDSLWEQRPE